MTPDLGDTYHRLTALEAAGLVNSGRAPAAELVQAALERLQQVDAGLHAFGEVWPDDALRMAREIDTRVSRGVRLPLAGVPIGVKASEGTGSLQARRLIEAGCVPIGATAVPGPGTGWQTWGYTDRGPTVNPWRADRVPGGSSAGSAAAVAAGIVPLATGSDGAGSLRIPAAWCGIVGVKPTNGLIPARDAAGLNVGGPLARSVADAAGYLDAVTDLGLLARLGPGRDAGWPGPSRATWSASLGYAPTDPEVASLARAAAERLAAAGLVRLVDVPVHLLDPEPAWRSLRGRRDPVRREPAARREAADEAASVRHANDQRLARVFAAVDLLLTPTTPNHAHGHEGPGSTMSVALTWAFNLSGHPALSLPAGIAGDGTPVGLQLVARHGDEITLLRVASAAEPADGWPPPEGSPTAARTSREKPRTGHAG